MNAKNLLCPLLVFIASSLLLSCKKQVDSQIETDKYYYWSGEKKNYLTQSENTFVLLTHEDKFENIKKSLHVKGISITLHSKNLYLMKSPNAATTQDIISEKNGFDTLNIGPTFTLDQISSPSGTSKDLIIPTNKITLKLKRTVQKETIINMLGNEFIAYESMDSFDIITIKHIKNVFNLSNKIYEKGMVDFAHPDMYMPLFLNLN